MTAILAGAMLLSPLVDPVLLSFDIRQLPAVVTIYDPALGGINCGDGCETIATGLLMPEHYETIAACDVSLLGAWVTFPGIGEFRCMDTGGMIRPMWSDYYQRTILYFDILYPLVDEDPPEWNYALIENWEVSWAGGKG